MVFVPRGLLFHRRRKHQFRLEEFEFSLTRRFESNDDHLKRKRKRGRKGVCRGTAKSLTLYGVSRATRPKFSAGCANWPSGSACMANTVLGRRGLLKGAVPESSKEEDEPTLAREGCEAAVAAAVVEVEEEGDEGKDRF